MAKVRFIVSLPIPNGKEIVPFREGTGKAPKYGIGEERVGGGMAIAPLYGIGKGRVGERMK